MWLIMFDVDGTLVKGNGIDSICYCEAIKDVFGIRGIDTDWSHYAKVTDWGITVEIIEKALKREATIGDIYAVRQSYLYRLEKEISESPTCFHALPGARQLLERLRVTVGFSVCVATGGWRNAAFLKLRTVGINCNNLPFASSDDSYERTEIMLAAHHRALNKVGCRSFEKVVYVGDHTGDFVNAKKLGYSFIGIGASNDALKLSAVGVQNILPDYANMSLFMNFLELSEP